VSGPKVVRIVTREELLAAGEQVLVRLEAELEQWRVLGSSISELSPTEIATTTARREELAALLRSDKFDEFRTAAVREIDYLQADLERRRDVAAQAEAKRITSALRTRENAYALIRALKMNQAINARDLISQLESIAHGAIQGVGGRSAEEVLRQGFCAISTAGATSEIRELTEAQRALARRLADGLQDTSFDAWRDSQAAPDEDPRFEHLARRLAVLATLGDPQGAQVFAENISQLQQGEPSAARNMHFDSLVLKVEEAISKAKAHSQLLAAAAKLVKALEVACTDESSSVRADLERAAEQGEHSAVNTLIETGKAILAEGLKRSIADARRQAVLRGLVQLGYEVRENMAAAWAKSGRLVLIRPDRSGYGVELAGSADVERMQVRVVAFSHDRDSRRDLDAESQWCSEFSQLSATLKASGSQLIIEKAASVGQVPIRVVEPSQNNPLSGNTKRNAVVK
jgi:hypothetical protein